METIKDFNKDGKIDVKDFIFYGMTIVGNVILTLLNIVH